MKVTLEICDGIGENYYFTLMTAVATFMLCIEYATSNPQVLSGISLLDISGNTINE